MTFFKSCAAAALLTAFVAPVAEAGPKALTWVVKADGPDWVIVGADDLSDPYNGDTDDTRRRHILCFVPGTLPMPATYQAHFNGGYNPFYHGWSGGKLGLGGAYNNADIPTLAAGDALCAQDLQDPDARWMEFHDNGVGGWNLGAQLHPNSKRPDRITDDAQHYANYTGPQKGQRRYHITINDQTANLFD